MSSDHTFTLILSSDPTPYLDALFEAGCDDALFGAVDGVHYAEFSRASAGMGEALSTAIAAIETTRLRVRRVEPDDLVTLAEIAVRLGRTRESVRLLASGGRGPGDFPPPISHTRERSRLWRLSEVLDWAQEADAAERHDAALIAAVNAALELRERLGGLDASARETVRGLANAA